MQQDPSWEYIRSSPNQDIEWKSKVRYRVHIPLFFRFLSQINPLDALQIPFKIYFNIILYPKVFHASRFPQLSPPNPCMHLPPPPYGPL